MLYLIFMPAILCSTFALEIPKGITDNLQNLLKSKEIDGYSIAEVHAYDHETGRVKRQTERDIRNHAHDLTSKKNHFSLHLDNGDHLTLNLERRSVLDVSKTQFFVNDHHGKRAIPYKVDDCFFTGPVETEEGESVFTFCHGIVHGGVETNKRSYSVHNLKSSENDSPDQGNGRQNAKRVLVTWKNVQKFARRNDILNETEADVEAARNKERIATKKAPAIVEFANYIDKYYIEDLKNNWELTSDEDILSLQLSKYTRVAMSYRQAQQYKLYIQLVLVNVEIWRVSPSFYVTSLKDRIGQRMKAMCKKKQDLPLDHIQLSTGQTSDRGRLGLSYIGAVCRPKFRCSVVRTNSNTFHVEAHELGHNLGLNHDGKMTECKTDKDLNGFMGGNKLGYFRKCYADVLERYFKMRPCLFQNDYVGEVERAFPLLIKK